MRASYDYFTATDGLPGNTMVGTRWVDPTVRLGRMVAKLTGRAWTPSLVGLSRVASYPSAGESGAFPGPSVSALDDRVRDAFAGVPAEEIGDLGAWWATTDEIEPGRLANAEAAALLRALVEICTDAVAAEHHLYVASGF